MLNGVEVVAMGGSGENPTSASNSILLALNPRDEVASIFFRMYQYFT